MSKDPRRFFDWKYTQDFCLNEITTYEDKARLYAVEATFRETLHAYAAVADLDDAQLGEAIRNVGLGLLRPDALAHRKVEESLAYFARLGARPTSCTATRVTSQTVRDVWRYQLNVASGERMRLLDLLFGATPAILVLFAADPDVPVPCAAMMADSKGEADPDAREGWELRAHLNSPHRIEVYVHIADEPIDVVRDGGILLGPESFAAAMSADQSSDVTADVLRLSKRVEREHGAAGRVCDLSDPLLRAALARTGQEPAPDLDRWQVIRSLGAACEMYAGPGENIICHPGTDSWWARAGLLADRFAYLSERATKPATTRTAPVSGRAQ